MKMYDDWRKLPTDLRSIHIVTFDGNFPCKVGHSLNRIGIQWKNVSEKG